MNIREKRELLEEQILSPFATQNINAIREIKEEKCEIRTEFQKDKDRIVHCKAFRRLKDKTQVFIAPEGDHFRTRITHTLEVSQIARTIASALELNEDLTEAISLGHDLGHTPFGHLGEDVLSKLLNIKFNHNEQSIRVVQHIEKLNLTKQVLDGILNHRGALNPSTLEGKVVQISDKIAYITHDIDDAIRAGLLYEKDLPEDIINRLGGSYKNMSDFIILSIIQNSINKNNIVIEKNVRNDFYMLRKFMFKNVYEGEQLLKERSKFIIIIEQIYNYYLENYDKIPNEYKCKNDKQLSTLDYVSGMTDKYVINLYENIKKDL